MESSSAKKKSKAKLALFFFFHFPHSIFTSFTFPEERCCCLQDRCASHAIAQASGKILTSALPPRRCSSEGKTEMTTEEPEEAKAAAPLPPAAAAPAAAEEDSPALISPPSSSALPDSFDSVGLDARLLRGLAKMDISKPTAVQVRKFVRIRIRF